MTTHGFSFASKGVGELLRHSPLAVPANQRSYAWKDEHVTDLLQDVTAAFDGNEEDYFLGTIVLVQSGEGRPQVADGQQRLATTSIIIARARDLLHELGRVQSANELERSYLQNVDIYTEDMQPRLTLNDEDKSYFSTVVISRFESPSDKERLEALALTPSNKRLAKASNIAEAYLRSLVSRASEERKHETLLEWLKYFTENASAVVVTVPDDVGAFRMFETLNDRGLRASQADILKNYLFSKVTRERFTEAQYEWNTMASTISAIADDDNEDLVNYIRYFWILENGLTREKELARNIKSAINSQSKALKFLSSSRAAAKDYAALWSLADQKWADYDSSAKKSLATLVNTLRADQILPLLFAVSVKFSPQEATKAFGLLVSWSVRFLIAGQGKAGRLDKPYSELAQKIGTGEIVTARDLRDAFADKVPTDSEFQEAFSVARVSKTHLARYYLRSLELTKRAQKQPEFVPNTDETEVNLEHILPVSGGNGWPVHEDNRDAAYRLIGNMVLLPAGKNVALGNSSFAEKRDALAESEFLTTREAAGYADWDLAAIRDRQMKLAALAPSTWSLKFG